MNTSELVRLASDSGVTVEYRDLGVTRKGAYIHNMGLIVISTRLAAWQEQCTLAHECGHMIHEDNPQSGRMSAMAEARADAWAVHALVPDWQYEQTAEMYECDPGAIAAELGITRSMAEAWRPQPCCGQLTRACA